VKTTSTHGRRERPGGRFSIRTEKKTPPVPGTCARFDIKTAPAAQKRQQKTLMSLKKRKKGIDMPVPDR